jgi:threonine dehydratase
MMPVQASPPPTVRDVLAAKRVVSAHLPLTPVVTHPILSRHVGCDVWVKLENTQPIGAFKARGGVNLMAHLEDAELERGLCTATRGNHGQSLAYAARLRDVQCTIFVPRGNNPDKNATMEALGAEVVVAGRDFDEAQELAARHARKTGARLVHPGEEPALIAGVGTLALEMLEQVPRDLDAIVLPVGVGSCIAGCALAIKAISPGTRVIGVQAAKAPAMYHAWRTGRLEPTSDANTIADGLAVRVPVAMTLSIMRDLVDEMVLISEDEIRAAIRVYAETLHQLAEGAGASALAGAIKLRRGLRGRRVGVVLSGGNIDACTLRHVMAA